MCPVASSMDVGASLLHGYLETSCHAIYLHPRSQLTLLLREMKFSLRRSSCSVAQCRMVLEELHWVYNMWCIICQEIPAEERIKLKSTPLPVKLSDFIQVKMPNGPLQSLTFNHGDGCIIRFQDCSGNVQGWGDCATCQVPEGPTLRHQDVYFIQ